MVKIDFIDGRVRVFIPLNNAFRTNLETVKAIGGGRFKDCPKLSKHHHFPMMKLPYILKALPQVWLGPTLAEFIQRTKKAQAIKSLKDAEQPVGIMIPLRPLQRVAVKFLSLYGRAILASDIGVGKTFCGIGWARGRAGLHKGKHGTLVVTKNAGKYAYQAEILRAVPGARVVVIEGRDGWFPTPGSTDWVIMNYELLAYRVEQIEAFGFESCIFSECHKLKGAKAPRQKADGTMAAGGTQRGGAGLEIGEFIPNILMETASLTPNRNGELFPLLQILGYVTEDDYYAWHVHFCGSTKVRPDGTIENFPAQKIKVNRRGLLRWDFSGSSFSDELHESIAPFTFAVTKKEALPELPDQYFTPTPVDITNMADYREATRHFLQWLQEEKGVEAVAKAKKALAIVKMGVLLQLAAKGVVQATVETLDSYADAKEKVVVFSSYKGPLADVEAKFPGLCVRITGDESAAEKDAAIQEFQRDPAKLFCLCTTEAGGESATLTAAQHGALYVPSLESPKRFEQGWGRVHQLRPARRGAGHRHDRSPDHHGRYRRNALRQGFGREPRAHRERSVAKLRCASRHSRARQS